MPGSSSSMVFLAVIVLTFLLKDVVASRMSCSVDGKVDNNLTQTCFSDYRYSCSHMGIIVQPAVRNETCSTACHCTPPREEAVEVDTVKALESRNIDPEEPWVMNCPVPGPEEGKTPFVPCLTQCQKLAYECHHKHGFSCDSVTGHISSGEDKNSTCSKHCFCQARGMLDWERSLSAATAADKTSATSSLTPRSEAAAPKKYAFVLMCPVLKAGQRPVPGDCDGQCQELSTQCAAKHGFKCNNVTSHLNTFPDSDLNSTCFDSCFCHGSYFKRDDSNASTLEPPTLMPSAAEVETLEERSLPTPQIGALEKRHEYYLNCDYNRTKTDLCANLGNGYGYTCLSTGRVSKLGSRTGPADNWCRRNCNCQSLCPQPNFIKNGIVTFCLKMDDGTSLVHGNRTLPSSTLELKSSSSIATIASASESAPSSAPTSTQYTTGLAVPVTTIPSPASSTKRLAREKRDGQYHLDCGHKTDTWECGTDPLSDYDFYCEDDGTLTQYTYWMKDSQSAWCKKNCLCKLPAPKSTNSKTSTKPKTSIKTTTSTKSKGKHQGPPSTMSTSTSRKP